MSNGTAESHTEPQDREREGKRQRESKGERDIERHNRGSTGFSEGLYKFIGRGEKHLGDVDIYTFMGPCPCVVCI